MRRARRWDGRTVAFLALALLCCGPSEGGDAQTSHHAAPLAHQEDEVCGMLVREQPAPRAQAVHRDGTRFFFCSLGDMLVHLGAPSPHGSTEAIFVEVLKPGEDPLQPQTGIHPWVRAEDAVFIVGVERLGIMGEPVLAYANRDAAEVVARVHSGARILDAEGLRDWWKARE